MLCLLSASQISYATMEKMILVRHRKPFWAYVNGQKSGTCFLNYCKRKKRSLRLYIQLKKRGSWKTTTMQITTVIPIGLMKKMMNCIEAKEQLKINCQGWKVERLERKKR